VVCCCGEAGGHEAPGGTLPDLQNCIVYHNNDGGAQLSGFTADDAAWFSCIQDCNEVNFNINIDPEFAYFEPDNVRIAYDSPCKDAGNTLLNYDDQVDMDGRIRVLEVAVDMGAYEISCDDVSNAWDWNADGRVDYGDFARLARVWRAHDPNDPALNDPDHPHYEYVNDPNGHAGPANLALWYPNGDKYNLSTVGYSEHAIDFADVVALIESPEWLVWTACWRQEEMMLGGEESMLLEFETMTFETQMVQEKSALEQMGELVHIIVQLESLWLNEAAIQQEINAEDWQHFMEEIYDSLVELYTGSVQIE
jgi:hypothetical protein